MKIQFILKRNEVYSFVSYTRRSSGLWNSTQFIAESLRERGLEVDIVECIDNNDIDREVSRFRPDTVIIEALWVIPEKFQVLSKLHPTVKWYCHLHSDMPFLALEGIAMDWIARYPVYGVSLIANSWESYRAVRSIVGRKWVTFLPNVYRAKITRKPKGDDECIRIACLGAIRPLKNQLLQAMAAIQFASEIGKPLIFLMNTTRVETGGEPVLKNIRQLFARHLSAQLLEIDWLEHDELLRYLHKNVDIGMQVSLTETFNVVTADYVSAGLPVVVSKEVKWTSGLSHAKDNSIDDIIAKMKRAWRWRGIIGINQWKLTHAQEKAEAMWYLFSISQDLNFHVQFKHSH